MLDQKKEVPADAKTGWVELKSKNGQEYRVKGAEYEISTAAKTKVALAARGPPFSNVQVNWTVGSSGATSQDIQDSTGITWYQLDHAHWWSPFQYQLTIKCNGNYDYFFTDASPDTYELDVSDSSGSHEVQYRSDKPTIVSISSH